MGYQNQNLENRPLAHMPEIKTDEGINIEFTSDLEDYLTDHFAFRPILATADAQIRAFLFNDSPTDQVIIGRQGWLFFEPTLNDYINYDVLSDNEMYRLTRTLSLQQDYLEHQDILFIVTIAPNKASIYPEYMPARFIQVEDINNYEKLLVEMSTQNVFYIDLHAHLREHSEQVYHKWDSHWNNLGAISVYHLLTQTIAEQRGDLFFLEYDEQSYTLTESWPGDLSNMVFPGLNLRDEQMEYDIDFVYSTARPMRTLEDLLIETTNSQGQGNLLMFRDSFANALIPFISNAFESVTFTRAIPYDYRYLTENTDVVIFEIAERNIPNILLSAPLMHARSVRIDSPVVETAGEAIVYVSEEDFGLRIMGVAIPDNHDPIQNYNLYFRLQSGETIDYVTFPILEDGVDASTIYSNVAFSAWLNTTELAPGEYSLSLIVEDETSLISLIQTDKKITVQH